MKALVVRTPGDYGIEEVPVPDVPEGGLLLRVRACGLCGSDLRTLRSGHRRVTLPWIIGHELCGIVERAGSGYRGPARPGDALVVGPLAYCGECEFCVAGRHELCEHQREIAQDWPGGFAEYVAVPEACVRLGNVQPLPPGLDPAFAAVTEPMSSCINAQEKAGTGLGDTVAIFGSGPVGCIHASVARARGAFRVAIVDVDAERLALAGPFGPDLLVNARQEDPVAALMRFTGGRGAEVVVTATPAPEAVIQAVAATRKGGRVVVFGGLPTDNAKPAVSWNDIHYKALHIIGTTTFAPRHHRRAIEMAASGRIPMDRLVTARYPLDRFDEGVRRAMEGKALKVVFLPESDAGGAHGH